MKHYKIIKLKSGEDLIGTVRLGKDGSVKIYRPMVFKAMVTQDMFGGMREVYILKDWLVLSQDKVAALSKDSINTIVKASKDISDLYEVEKIKDDMSPVRPRVAKPKKPNTQPDMMNDFFKEIENMFSKSPNLPEEESNLKDLAKPQKGDKMVFMNLVFSPEVIVELLKSGILDRKELGEMINEITNENGEGMNPDNYTGDKKEKKDLGNDWTDWPADPSAEDYK